MKNRILIVDDEPMIRFFLQDYLEDQSYDVDVAESLSIAREKIGANKPDLLLLDMKLGDGSGLDLLRDLRAAAATHELPILLMSADSQLVYSKTPAPEGANKYLVKPFDLKKLKEEVSALLPCIDS